MKKVSRLCGTEEMENYDMGFGKEEVLFAINAPEIQL